VVLFPGGARDQTTDGAVGADDDRRDVAGERLAAEAREDIERLGLGGTLTARYLPELGLVRIGRPAHDGTLPRGVDYPPDPEWGPYIREHLEVYERLSGRGRPDLKSLLWIGVLLSGIAS
jgi:hypothetical protein